MRFAVRHHTQYRYDAPVTLAPHVVRLTPRSGQGVLHAQRLHVEPTPTRTHERGDPHGNRVVELEFAGRCDTLRVDSSLEIETHPPAPLVLAGPRLPWRAAAEVNVDARVGAFAEGLAAAVDHAPVAFLDLLTHTLFTRIDRHVRHGGDAYPAAETLARGRGACRDLTVLFMDAARSLGLECRFVSGYQARAETPDGKRYLHAWPEVNLPGLGFRAWDPTHGLRVEDGHLALCAAPTQAETMPIEGSFFADGPVGSTLEFSLEIDARD